MKPRPPVSLGFSALSGRFRTVAAHTPARRSTPAPFSLRLSPEERAALERSAGNVSLGAYIRSRLFEESIAPRRAIRSPRPDSALLARVLAELGNSRLANNLNQLAKAANTGSLPVTPETEATLREAYTTVLTMRKLLVAALGLRE